MPRLLGMPRARSWTAVTLAITHIGICLFLQETSLGAQVGVAHHLVTVPETWRKVPVGELEPAAGYSWYRCLVQVPETWQGSELTLVVEALDDARAAYVNGANVGGTGTFPPQFRSGLGEKGRYRVDATLVRFGEFNAIAIRVFQNDPRPNFDVAPPVLFSTTGEAIRMNGKWQYQPSDEQSWSTPMVEDFGVDRDAVGSDNLHNRENGLYAKIDKVTDFERYVARRLGDNDPFSPEEAEKEFTTPDDLDFQLVLSEPVIAQPLFMNWDERGRMWLMEYRQYPEVAGLKAVSRDIYLRTVFDKVPQPPPHHEKGRDRISIHEDTDGDGVYDRHKIFVDGLNLATSFAQGRGGLWVTNPPYLLFYPDRDGDDVPDGDPEVHLQGFGLEDSHAVINSLRFGPDGWLYAAQGSTVSAAVKRPGTDDEPTHSLGQLIWRYHPERRKYEVFAEGGGNTFGVEIDAKGRVYSGHNGGNTRGFHYVQGGYYRKGFGKHGPLSNPYAFGYFESMKHPRVPRFTHNFVIYEADALPDVYHGRLFGVEPLQGQIVMSSFEPDQSSFQTEDISRPVATDDQWFRPVDIKLGPDGSLYVADMYEQRISHASHYAGRIDRTNGRVYRLRPGEERQAAPFDYSQLSGKQLVELLDHPNRWHRQTALRLLGDRRNKSLVPLLMDQLNAAQGQLALETLWALNLCGGLTDDVAAVLLGHDDLFVRAWTVRLVCDHRSVDPVIAGVLAELAADEPYIQVRKQLASSARRLPTRDALPIINNLLRHDEDASDIHQPLLLWWALEAHANDVGRELIFRTILLDPATWRKPLLREHLIQRLMKRFAIAGSRKDLLAAAKLLSNSPDLQSTELLLAGFEEAYKGRSLAGIPAELGRAIAESGGGSAALRLRQADPSAIAEAVRSVQDATVETPERLQFIQIFGETRRPEFIPVLLSVVRQEEDETLVSAALSALQPFEDPRISEAVIPLLSRFPEGAKLVAETLLASRTTWAVELLQAVDSGDLKPEDVSHTAIRKLLLHPDGNVQGLVAKHWSSVSDSTTEQMREEVNRLRAVLQAASGNPKKGKPLFALRCGKCHTLFGEGGQVGPDLTSFKRDDLERLLMNVVNPSAEIREGFENYMLLASDGRVVNGFLADQDNQVVVLRGVDGQNLIFRRDEIEELRAIRHSVMPEETLKELSEQQLRDLFSYFRSSQPVNY
jgi:putative heme-binding domain-containing protein